MRVLFVRVLRVAVQQRLVPPPTHLRHRPSRTHNNGRWYVLSITDGNGDDDGYDDEFFDVFFGNSASSHARLSSATSAASSPARSCLTLAYAIPTFYVSFPVLSAVGRSARRFSTFDATRHSPPRPFVSALCAPVVGPSFASHHPASTATVNQP